MTVVIVPVVTVPPYQRLLRLRLCLGQAHLVGLRVCRPKGLHFPLALAWSRPHLHASKSLSAPCRIEILRHRPRARQREPFPARARFTQFPLCSSPLAFVVVERLLLRVELSS